MKKYDYVLQTNSYDCGIACLQTIFLLHNKRINRASLTSLINKEKYGVSMYDLITSSNSLGLNALGVSAKIDNMKDSLPCIAHTIIDKEMYHFIVILEIHDDYILVMDPSYGLKKIDRSVFETITTNKYIIFSNTKFKKTKDVRLKNIILKIFSLNKGIIFKSIILSIIYSLFSLAFNYYLSTIVSGYTKSFNYLLIVFIVFINITIFKTYMYFQKNKLLIEINNNIDEEITKTTLNHLLYLPYDYFIETTSGEIATFISDIENFKDIISKILISTVLDVIFIIFILIYISFINIFYVVIFIIIIIILLILSLSYQQRLNQNYKILKDKRIKTSSYFYESLTSFNTIKNLSIENKIIDNLVNNNSITLDKNKKYLKEYYKFDLINNYLIDMFYLLVIIVSVFIVKTINGSISSTILIGNIFYLFIGLLSSVYENITMKKIYKTSVDKVLDILEMNKEEKTDNKFNKIREIVFNNVSYVKNDKTIINNLNLRLKENENVFITGDSGIGKSTIIRLLLRNHKVTSGKIMIDNININDLSLSFIRGNITYVSQNETLFQTTIKENLDLISNSKDKQLLCCKTTLLDKTFNTDNYLNIFLEENGNNVSTGQRKKIIIARALLKAKDILVLDESFNEISIEEERMILKNIFNNYPYLTVILISHRQDNSDLFDKIYKIKRRNVNERIK